MTTIERALVIGAGFIGTHVSAVLGRRRIACRVMTRSPLDEERIEHLGGAELVIADASVRPALPAAGDAVDHVSYGAGGLRPAEPNLEPAADVAMSRPPLLGRLERLRSRPGTGLTFISSGARCTGRRC